MNRSAFYGAVRASGVFGSQLSQSQVDGVEAILDAAENRRTELQFLAYMLATAYHETARTMRPIEEYGRGKGRKYGAPAGPYGNIYFGRGFVQLTWLTNYRRAGEEIGIDLVRHPERALEPGIAALILFEGTEQGWFTGKGLGDYIGAHGADYRNARRVINGTDHAEAIGRAALTFDGALKQAGYGAAAVAEPVAPDRRESEPSARRPLEPAATRPIPQKAAPTVWAQLIAALFRLLRIPLSRKA
jgi:putative chitinase